MSITKCPNGHYYDNKKYDECPHCNSSLKPNSANSFSMGNNSINESIGNTNIAEQRTEPIRNSYDANQRTEPMQSSFGTNQKTEPMQSGFGANQRTEPMQSSFGTNQKTEPMQSGFGANQRTEPMQSGFGANQKTEPMQSGLGANQKTEPMQSGFGANQKTEPIRNNNVNNQKTEPVRNNNVNNQKTEPVKTDISSQKTEPIRRDAIKQNTASPSNTMDATVPNRNFKNYRKPVSNDTTVPLNNDETNKVDIHEQLTEPIRRSSTDTNINSPIVREIQDDTVPNVNNIDPAKYVVGWLIAIDGPDKGRDYKVYTGKNFIGRSASMNIVMMNDDKIAENNHACLVYEPRKSLFYLVSDNGSTYINDNSLMGASQLNDYDIIQMGDTKLHFIAYCKGEITWKKERK